MAERLRSGDKEQKRETLLQLTALRSVDASRVAATALNDREAVVRAQAASAVTFLPPGEAASLLLPLLRDKDAFVRRQAAYTLGAVGDRSATPALIRALSSDKDPEVRTAGAVALGEIGDPSAMSSLVAVFDRGPKEDNEMLRRAACRSIGQIAAAILTGKTGPVSTPRDFLPPHYKQIDTLSAVSTDASVFAGPARLMMRVLDSKSEADDTRREAAFALGAMRYGAAASLLGRYAEGPDPYLAETCKEALIKIRSVE